MGDIREGISDTWTAALLKLTSGFGGLCLEGFGEFGMCEISKMSTSKFRKE